MNIYSFRPKILITYCSLILLVAGCTYKQNGEYFRDLSMPVAPQATFSNSFGSDTLLCITGDPFTITFSAGANYSDYNLDIFEGNVKKASTRSNNGVFELSPHSIVSKAGIYDLTFVFSFSTGSGSIADNMGAEEFTYSRNMVMVFYDWTSGFYPEISFSPAGGTLSGTVTIPGDAPMIRKVKISKRFDFGEAWEIATIIGSTPFTFEDHSYVGEDVTYMIQTYMGNNEGTYFYPCSQGSGFRQQEIQKGTFTLDANGIPVIQWPKTDYPLNCNGYRIINKISDDSAYDVTIINNLEKDSIHNADIGFPGNNNIYVSYIPKLPPPGYDREMAMYNYAESMYCSAGLPSFNFGRFYSPVGNDIFTDGVSGSIFRYSATTGNQIDHLTTTGWFYAIAVSPNDKYLLAATGNSTFDYLLYNITTRVTTYIPSSSVLGSGGSAGAVSVSDEGIGAVAGYNKLVIYDFVNHVKILEQGFNQEPRPVISPNGKYFFASADYLYLFSISGSTATQIWRSPGGTTPYKYYSFVPSDEEKVILVENQLLSVRNAPGMGIIRSFNMNMTNLGNIDHNSGRLLCYDDTHFRIYDFNTGGLIRQMRLGDGYGGYLRVRGNTVYSGDSKKIKF
ncbi:MAG: hypothetical protein ACM3N9_02345 [Syntrophothermus sp.]